MEWRGSGLYAPSSPVTGISLPSPWALPIPPSLLHHLRALLKDLLDVRADGLADRRDDLGDLALLL